MRKMWELAGRSLASGLIKLQEEGRIQEKGRRLPLSELMERSSGSSSPRKNRLLYLSSTRMVSPPVTPLPW